MGVNTSCFTIPPVLPDPDCETPVPQKQSEDALKTSETPGQRKYPETVSQQRPLNSPRTTAAIVDSEAVSQQRSSNSPRSTAAIAESKKDSGTMADMACSPPNNINTNGPSANDPAIKPGDSTQHHHHKSSHWFPKFGHHGLMHSLSKSFTRSASFAVGKGVPSGGGEGGDGGGGGDHMTRCASIPTLSTEPGEEVKKGPVAPVDVWVQFKRGPEIGRGQFGVLFFVTQRDTGERLALKQILKSNMKTAVDVEDVKREIMVMHLLPQHPHIIRMKNVLEDKGSVNIVMELCEGGDLASRIVHEGVMSESDAATVFNQVLMAIQHMHNHRVIHRDLKPENFLFCQRGSNYPLKAIDFGLSVLARPGEIFKEIVGSPVYMAPELLQREYGLACDVWSAGVILYVIICGVPPFYARKEEDIKRMILTTKVQFKEAEWKSVSSECIDLVKKLLEKDQLKRITATDALGHPWFEKCAKKSMSVATTARKKSYVKQSPPCLSQVAALRSGRSITGPQKEARSPSASPSKRAATRDLQPTTPRSGRSSSQKDTNPPS